MSKRADAIGFFWEDHAKIKPPKKEKVKRIPPDPFWERPEYLPGLEFAKKYMPDLYTDMELYHAQQTKEPLAYDIEVYPNYCCFAFKGLRTGKVLFFELHKNDASLVLPGVHNAGAIMPRNTDYFNADKLNWVLKNFQIINFNGRKYDFPVTTLALAGYTTEDLWDATCMLIVEELGANDVYRKYKTHKLEIDQIDLIELTALGPGLKVCAGRLHAPRLQDLPFKPGTYLTNDQITILRYYNINDLDNTIILHNSLTEQITLRESVGKKYGLDLRSHSDAQMAEAIIGSELRKRKRVKYIQKTKLPAGTKYKFQTPSYIRFQTPLLNYVLNLVQNATFHVDHFTGNIIMPPEMEDYVFTMGNSTYSIGLGGMHTQEKSVAHVTDDKNEVIDTDVTSYYPYLILNAGMAPENLGRDFLIVFKQIVETRVAAKKSGDMVTAECLKIVINGTFGKLGSKWSIMYAPNLLLQVTLTGQLSILMLAEACELSGIEVCSVNTDGVVVKCPREKRELFNDIVKWWQNTTGLSTEETRYQATYSKDVNNYIAVYDKPQKGDLFKTKGLYAKTSSKKNAVNEICIKAVKDYIELGTNPAETIRGCKDVKMFTSMRYAKFGALKPAPGQDPNLQVTSGEYLGKLIRWYYAVGETGLLVSAKTGNKIAKSDGAKPLMNLPAELPDDIDYERYIAECYKILDGIGYNTFDNAAVKAELMAQLEGENDDEDEDEADDDDTSVKMRVKVREAVHVG